MTKNNEKQNVVGIIPARGGSKGIPKKNIYSLACKPLLAYTIEAALNSNTLSKVLVSTDSEEIAGIALKFGAEVVFRPEELAATIYHALDIPVNNPQDASGISRSLTTGKPIMDLFG